MPTRTPLTGGDLPALGHSKARALALVLLLSGLSPSAAHAQCAGSWVNSPISQTGFADGRVLALHQWDQDGLGSNPPILVAAGGMTLSGTTSVGRVCRFDPAANSGAGGWVKLGDGLDGEVNVLITASNGDLVAGGWFQNSGLTSTRFVARFDGVSWQPYSSGMNSTVWALAERPAGASGGSAGGAGQLFAGGWFQLANGNAVNRITRWTGTNWATVGPAATIGASDWVWDIQVAPNGDMIAGGAFASINGVAAPKIARWNGSVWSGLGSGLVASEVYEVFPLPNGDIVASGNISASGSTPLRFVARWNSALGTWSPMGNTWNGSCRGFFLTPAGDLHALNVNNPDFTRIQIVRWDGTAWQPVATADSTIFASAVLSNGDVAIGGSFTTVDGTPANRIAIWRPGAINPASLPVISAQPANVDICPGGQASFSVTASVASGTPTYLWRKNGTQIFTSTNPTATSPTLTINNAQPADAGAYDCVVFAPCGLSITTIATLSICRADIDCTGVLSPQDIFEFLNLWFTGAPAADYNSVGGITPQDIFDFLNDWFVGCP